MNELVIALGWAGMYVVMALAAIVLLLGLLSFRGRDFQ